MRRVFRIAGSVAKTFIGAVLIALAAIWIFNSVQSPDSARLTMSANAAEGEGLAKTKEVARTVGKAEAQSLYNQLLWSSPRLPGGSRAGGTVSNPKYLKLDFMKSGEIMLTARISTYFPPEAHFDRNLALTRFAICTDTMLVGKAYFEKAEKLYYEAKGLEK